MMTTEPIHEMSASAPPSLQYPAWDASTRPQSRDLDGDRLMFVGKEPVLKRNFGFMSILGFSSTILISWEAALIGGPSGMVYGCFFSWLGTSAMYACLSELNSMAPTASGQYHWVSMLAPRSASRFLSYITGWLTVIGWQAFVASASYGSATLLQGLVIMLYADTYSPYSWHVVLLFYAFMMFAVIFNAVISRALPAFEGMILILHVVGFFAIVVPLIFLAPHASSKDVFMNFYNGGNFPNTGLSVMVGMMGNAWVFAGADGAVHMSEEIRNAAIVVPRAIQLSTFVNGLLCMGMVVTCLYCMGTEADGLGFTSLLSTETKYPFMIIFEHATESNWGAAVMISIVIVMSACAIVGQVAAASRLTWSFARDKGLPGWRTLIKVHPDTSIPVNTVLITFVCSCLLSLITLGSTRAFDNLVSISIVGLYMSYFLAALLLLYRRCQPGAIITEDQAAAHTYMMSGRHRRLTSAGSAGSANKFDEASVTVRSQSPVPTSPVTPKTTSIKMITTVADEALVMKQATPPPSPNQNLFSIPHLHFSHHSRTPSEQQQQQQDSRQRKRSREKIVFNTEGAQLVWGPWRLRGGFGIAVNAIACVYLLVIIFFSFWPAQLPATPANMQYSSLMIGAAVCFSAAWYVAAARHEYRGPIIEVGTSGRP